MMFHPDKCKVVTIKHRPSPLAMLPFVAYHYQLAESLLSHADSEKDLGDVCMSIKALTLMNTVRIY